MRILKIAGAIELGALSTNDFVLVFVTYGRRECLSVDVLEPLECTWIDSRRARVQNGPSAELSVLNRSETIWDYVYRRFGITQSEKH